MIEKGPIAPFEKNILPMTITYPYDLRASVMWWSKEMGEKKKWYQFANVWHECVIWFIKERPGWLLENSLLLASSKATFALFTTYKFVLAIPRNRRSKLCLYKLFKKLLQSTGTHPQLVSNRLSPTCREAMPKSAMRMLFFSSRRRFSGFRSLWLHKHHKTL